jgi:hypothetical protein
VRNGGSLAPIFLGDLFIVDLLNESDYLAVRDVAGHVTRNRVQVPSKEQEGKFSKAVEEERAITSMK